MLLLLPAPPHDETGHTWHHDNQLLFDPTKFGGAKVLAARGITGFNRGMDGFADVIGDVEIWDILTFIQSTCAERFQKIQQERNPPH